MKRILLGLVALFSFLPLMAQDEHEYIPYVRDCEFGYFGYDFEKVVSFVHYWIEDDFELDGKTYKGFYHDKTGEKKLIGYVREENQKVYFRDKDREWPWYNFTLEAGDIFIAEAGSPLIWKDSHPLEVMVDEAGDQTIAGKIRKYVGFDISEHNWLEGIGEMTNLPFFAFEPPADCICGYQLFYIKEHDEFIYRETEWRGKWGYEYNTPIIDPYLEGVGGIKETQKKELQVVAQGEQWVITLPSDDCRMIEVIDTTGRVVWCEYLDDNTDRVIIPTSAFGKAIYIVTLTAQNGERITCKVTL